MKKIIIISLLFFVSVHSSGQVILYSLPETSSSLLSEMTHSVVIDSTLRIDMYNSRYELNTRDEDYHSSFFDLGCSILRGEVIFQDSLLICVDAIRNERIVFKHLDEYRLISVNKTRFFDEGKILYAILIRDYDDRNLQIMDWLNGLRHGWWRYATQKGNKVTHYDNGKIVKVFFRPDPRPSSAPPESPLKTELPLCHE